MTIHPEKHIPQLIEIFNNIREDLINNGCNEGEAHFHTLHFFGAFDADDYDEEKQKKWLEQHPDFRNWLESREAIKGVDDEDMIRCLKILETEEDDEQLVFLSNFIHWLEERPHNGAWMTLKLIHHWKKKYHEEKIRTRAIEEGDV